MNKEIPNDEISLKELIEKAKPTMKLYTREQMIKAFNYGQKVEGFDWIGDMIDSLEAIELPSDEGIKKIMELDDMEFDEFDPYHLSHLDGAKWMRDKIKLGNK